MNLRSTVLISLLLLALAAATASGAAGEESAPAPTPAAAPAPAAPSAWHSAESTQTFHVTLLLGDQEAPASVPANLPKGVQKAIADIGEFLPYKSYHVAGSAVLRTASNEMSLTFVEGPNAERYRVTIRFADEGAGKLLIRNFVLANFSTNEQPLSTTLQMSRGETVVVGTSDLKGGKALIALLTALP